MTESTHYLSVSAVSDTGLVREQNEDALVVADVTSGKTLAERSHARFNVGAKGVLLAVSDGMGGAAAGEVASALVIETMTREIANVPVADGHAGEGRAANVPVADGDGAESEPEVATLTAAVERAHEAVWAQGQRNQAPMGATLTAVFVRHGRAYIAEVGDSRAYLVRGGRIAQITHDQSMVQLLVDSGVMNAEDASRSPMRNIILQAMGHQRDIKVAVCKLDLKARDCLVLCSDGLTGHVGDDEIRDVVVQLKRPKLVAARLVELANERGGQDNTTVIVAGVGGALAPPMTHESLEDAVEVIAAYDMTPPSG